MTQTTTLAPIRYKRTRRTQQLKDMLEPLASPSFKKRGFIETRMLADWPAIIGRTLADVTRPQKITFPPTRRRQGTLHLQVESGWAPEIQHLEPIILDKLATYFGYRAVEKIHIIQGPSLPKPPRKSPETPILPPSVALRASQADSGGDLKKMLENLSHIRAARQNQP